MNGHNNNRSEKDKALDRLITQADQKHSQIFYRPSDECIYSYLTGQSSDEQKEEMWTALDVSPAFRNEILEMADDIEVFASQDTTDKSAQLDMNQVPVRVLRTVENRERYRSFRILVPVAVAALLVFVIVQSLKKTNPPVLSNTTIPLANLELFNSNVDPGLLVSMQPRGANDTVSFKVHTAPDSAALAEFRFLLEYDKGEFKFRREPPQPAPNKNSRTVQLKIQDDTGKIIKEFSAIIPVSDSVTAPVEAWILNLPDRSLYKVDMSKDTVAVKVDPSQISNGCVTFTYGGDKWFGSTFGFIFNFEEAK